MGAETGHLLHWRVLRPLPCSVSFAGALRPEGHGVLDPPGGGSGEVGEAGGKVVEEQRRSPGLGLPWDTLEGIAEKLLGGPVNVTA